MKRSLKRKVRALGVLQVTLMAGIMLLLGVLFFHKMLTDQQSVREGTRQVKRRDVEGLAKLLALELGRIESLRYARSNPRHPIVSEVRSVLWEKVTFVAELADLDLVARGPTEGGPTLCIRPMGRPQSCAEIPGIDELMARFDAIDRMERVGENAYAVPLYVAGSFWGIMRLGLSNVTVSYALQQLAAKNKQDKTAFVILFVACLTVGGVVLFLVLAAFLRRMHGPLLALSRNAETFGGRPDAPLEPVGADPEDEIGVLAGRFEDMQRRLAETIEALQKSVEQKERAIRTLEEKDQLLRRSERLASVGVLAAGVAHEIGNKLNPMGFVVHNLRRRLEKGKPPDEGQLEILTRSIESSATIIEKLRSLARPSEQRSEPVSLNAVVEDVVLLLDAQSRSRGIVLEKVLADGLPSVSGVHGDLVQVVINLVVNARDAVAATGREGGRIVLSTSLDARGRPTLEVSDDGTGMSDEVKARVFEPFFTTKGLATGGGEGGTGLGLYICYGILSRHGVEPEIVTAPGQGTRFVMAFPTTPA